MKREDIEKECEKYSQEATPTYVNGDFDRYAIAQSFEDGANWRINSVWHNVTELPKKNCCIVYLTKDNIIGVMRYMNMINCQYRLQEYKMWAYKDDLLPNKEE